MTALKMVATTAATKAKPMVDLLVWRSAATWVG